ncbi:MAG: RelA/SpoT family protein [Paracoccaceae bacterium]
MRAYNPQTDAALVMAAFEYGASMHAGQTRRSGEAYFHHPVAVATILAEQQLDDATIVTALLHDTLEDTRAGMEDLSARFGPEIARLVDGVTNLRSMALNSTETKTAENFRKLFVATARDVRVALVKLADRLHNMRTIGAMPAHKREQKSRETMEIYAPLAGRMGMQGMREELEDLAFAQLTPEHRKLVLRNYARLKGDNDRVVPTVIAEIEAALAAAGIEAEVVGRAKRPYSIWRKMQVSGQQFDSLSDVFGFRILVSAEADCYRALGVVHGRWGAVPGRFKDYISQPKDNGYRSIHTTVARRGGMRVEVQIRTIEMHEVAESGVAAHWSYRDGERASNRFAVDPARWIETLRARLDDAGDGEDDAAFLEAVKLEMYTGQVFCFTPKGRVVQLPRGATPLDFAYAVHTRIGETCVGARVDGTRQPLWHKLRNGQTVEIVTADGQKPVIGWLEFAQTGRARAAIRRSLREQRAEREVATGREYATLAFENAGRRLTDRALATAARLMGHDGPDDLLARLGRAEVTSRDLLKALYPDIPVKPGPLRRAQGVVFGLTPGTKVRRAACCAPLPGERIVGVTFRDGGAVIHAIHCANLAHYPDERWVDISWGPDGHGTAHPVRLSMTIANDAGVLGRVCSVIGESGANIEDLSFTERRADVFELSLDLLLRDMAHWTQLRTTLEAEAAVTNVQRQHDLTKERPPPPKGDHPRP